MSNERRRKRIAAIAAQLMYEQHEKEYFQAKRKAAKRIYAKTTDLPSNREIRESILEIARIYEGEAHKERLQSMRLAALKIMTYLEGYHPRIIGSVLTGHIHKASDIDLHVFTNDPLKIADDLDDLGIICNIEKKKIEKYKEERVFTHIHFSYKGFSFELSVYDFDKLNFNFTSSITLKPIEKANIKDLKSLILKQSPNIHIESEINEKDIILEEFRDLLEPLFYVQQNSKYHPEGDVLYHSLQVFELAREKKPHDVDFLIAALLHDVGKGIDPKNHVQSGLQSLDGLISEKVEFLVEHHMNMLKWNEGRLSKDIKKEIKNSPYFGDLKLLRWADDNGRKDGIDVCSLNEALEYIGRLIVFC